MLRNKNLIPLSHQHQRALALCVRIDRASPIGDADLAVWQAEISQLFQSEIGVHFAAEEQVLFPAALRFEELVPLVEDLEADHVSLRERFAQAEAHNLSSDDLSTFGARLSTHIRKEERQLFERLQELMNPEELSRLGQELQEALKASAQTCILPTETTRLRPTKARPNKVGPTK
jgi:hemerythrin-like domain-containing protein